MHSSILRPLAYSGNCGPGTLVVPVLTLRCGSRPATRAPSISSTGRNPSDVSTSPATAWLDSLRSAICSATDRSRSTGSSISTGSSANTPRRRLL